ncbi:MAG: Rne/Rng family ribonuclease [Planctomycetota bacterium]|jgi:ribonuclease E
MRLLLINAAEPEETRAALVEKGQVEEYRCERSAAGTLVGNIYKGKVVNLERGLGAAFVDIGVGRNGFLHQSARPGAELPALEDEILVQVTRESVGSKGPMLSEDLSLPGRFLVYLPRSEGGGISRRIGDEENRAQLRALARELEQDAGAGLIVRTAGAHRTKPELERDLHALQRLWAAVERRAKDATAPALLYAEDDLVARAVRDLVDPGVTAIHVDTPEALARAADAVRVVQPEVADRLRLHAAAEPLFHAFFDIESQIDRLRARRVPLPSGGSIVFDLTEALVAVDVNSGRTREEEGLEETALRTNLEAATEISRQLRLRDLGGVIVVDFIDMRDAGRVRAVERTFRSALARDRARVRPGRLGAFGIFVLTRRRAGAGGVAARHPCPHCSGSGEVVRPDEIALRLFRELRARAAGRGEGGLRARASPEVAEILATASRGVVQALSEEAGREIRVEPDASLAPGGWEVDAV